MSDDNRIKRLEVLRKEMNETLNELKELMFRPRNNGCAGMWRFKDKERQP